MEGFIVASQKWTQIKDAPFGIIDLLSLALEFEEDHAVEIIQKLGWSLRFLINF